MIKTIRARLYAFAFVTTLRQFWGLTVATWLWIGLALLLVLTLLLRWWWAAAAVALGVVLLRWVFRRARKNGYATFEKLYDRALLEGVDLLPPHHKVPVRATGLFAAGQREHHVLLRKGEMWHIPLDEHAIMVERAPGSYLYQFVQPQHTQKVRAGTFLFGAERLPGLEVTYFTDWSPQIDTSGIAYYVGGGFSAEQRLKRTIYLAFDDREAWLMVWKSFAERTSLTE